MSSELHPVSSLSPKTCEEVGKRMKISRVAAYYHLKNNDLQAWELAFQIERERQVTAKQIAEQLASIQGSKIS